MTIVATVAMLGACIGLTIAALGIALSAAPGWRHHRAVYLLALACGVFCACDVVATLEVDALLRERALRVSLFALSWAMASWTALATSRFPSPALQSRARWLISLHVGLGFLALIPGVMVTEQVRTREVAWLGVTYYDVLPTRLGECVLYCVGLSLGVIAVHVLRAARRGVKEAWLFSGWALGLLLSFVVDSLSFIGWVNGPYISAPVLVGVMIWMSAFTVRKFIENSKALEDLSTRLELRVEERTQALAQAHEALARSEKLAAIGQLAAGVAHEINNPAAAVTANLNYLSECLEEGAPPEDALQCVEESRTSMRRIARIVRQLLDTGRPSSNESVDWGEETEVAHAVRDAAAIVRAVVPSSAQVHLSVPEGLRIRGKAQLLEQILTNLMVNSGHAIAAGRGHGRIEVSARSEGQELLLEVRDDGCGMDESTQKRIFDPFFTTKPLGQGTGLGLSVTAGLVNSLGGSLTVQSSVGVGTLMQLKFPSATLAGLT